MGRKINIRKRKHRNRSKSGKGRRWLFRVLLILLALTALQLARHVFQDEEMRVRTYIREMAAREFPEEAAEIKASFGLKPYLLETDDSFAVENDKHLVVLIHGLDDPGKVWNNLAPRLTEKGYRVWLMIYPNDQPVVESAKFFLEELEKLKGKGVESIDVVAHSMGGLVTREMLTNPDWSFEGLVRSGRTPRLRRFIMVGTPNHGSELARFRILTEFRDQLAHIFHEDYNWLRPILDGAGEAGLDLLPGSRFIETLNNRPQPQGIEMMVIAGVMSPWQVDDTESFIESVRNKLPGGASGGLDKMDDWLNSMSNGLGDGLVTVDSTRLESVPHHIVPGAHLTIIRNLGSESQREPPAIPLIIEELSRNDAAAKQGARTGRINCVR